MNKKDKRIDSPFLKITIFTIILIGALWSYDAATFEPSGQINNDTEVTDNQMVWRCAEETPEEIPNECTTYGWITINSEILPPNQIGNLPYSYWDNTIKIANIKLINGKELGESYNGIGPNDIFYISINHWANEYTVTNRLNISAYYEIQEYQCVNYTYVLSEKNTKCVRWEKENENT